jgi:hypothetical protein
MKTLQDYIRSLQISIVNVHDHPRLHLELLNLLNVEFNANPNQSFHSDADLDPNQHPK